MLFFPPVRLSNRDWTHLMQLAFDAKHNAHAVTPFLRSEVHRAIVLENLQDDIVRLNAWVTYRLDKRPPEKRLLVHPRDYVPGERQLSVLSSLGAALLGIRVGDAMPFLCTEDNLHLVTPLAVDQKAVPSLLMAEKPRSEQCSVPSSRSPFDELVGRIGAQVLPACCEVSTEQPQPASAGLDLVDAPDA
jgi:hypothetical protein